MRKTDHIGLTALEAERTKLLQEYDAAVAQAEDDPVKTEQGVSCEASFRSFLERFLPRKYGVTKGYIITPDREYSGPLEEWDIIIYDAMESPVLFVRRNRDENEVAGMRGIPVEYVRGVVEVKATFNKAMAAKATDKLLKLRQFLKTKDEPPQYEETHLPSGFKAFAVFFETKVANSKEYTNALGALAPFWQTDPSVEFRRGLIIRGQSCPEYSAAISYAMGTAQDFTGMFVPQCEISYPVPSCVEGLRVVVISEGYSENSFWQFMIGMIHALNGNDSEYAPAPKALIGGYGQRSGSTRYVRLFPLT